MPVSTVCLLQGSLQQLDVGIKQPGIPLAGGQPEAGIFDGRPQNIVGGLGLQDVPAVECVVLDVGNALTG